MKVSWEYEIPNIWKVIKFMFQLVKPPTSNRYVLLNGINHPCQGVSIPLEHIPQPGAWFRPALLNGRLFGTSKMAGIRVRKTPCSQLEMEDLYCKK